MRRVNGIKMSTLVGVAEIIETGKIPERMLARQADYLSGYWSRLEGKIDDINRVLKSYGSDIRLSYELWWFNSIDPALISLVLRNGSQELDRKCLEGIDGVDLLPTA